MAKQTPSVPVIVPGLLWLDWYEGILGFYGTCFLIYRYGARVLNRSSCFLPEHRQHVYALTLERSATLKSVSKSKQKRLPAITKLCYKGTLIVSYANAVEKERWTQPTRTWSTIINSMTCSTLN